MPEEKSLGAAIDEIIAALTGLDEAARATAIRAACDHIGVKVTSGPRSADSVTEIAYIEGPEPAAPGTSQHADVRSIKEQKQPGSAIEMACIVAYYLQHARSTEQKNEITAADIEKYFVQASFPLPRRSDQLLVDAKAAGYFDSAARGVYRLNAVGHNLVAHTLPRKSSVKAVSTRARKRPRANTVKRGKKQ